MTKARVISGVLLFLAVVFSWIWILTLFNRLYIYFHRDRYRVESFEVVDTVSASSSKRFQSRWLTGTVAGRTERFRPQLPPGYRIHGPDDLLALFPRGSNVSVLYDPEALEANIQGESVRVLHFTPDFWAREQRMLINYLCFVGLPVPLALAFYRAVRKRPEMLVK